MEAVLAGLKAAAEPTRLRLLALLAQGELTVSELTQILGQSQPRVSRHLRLMCEAGLLDRFPEGAWVFYRLARQGVGSELSRALLTLMDGRQVKLGQDRIRLEAVRQARAERAAQYFRERAQSWNEIRSADVDQKAVEDALIAVFAGRGVREVVDMGTGTGRVLEILAPHVERGVGFDLSREMLAVARANLDRPEFGHCMVRQADISQLPLADQSVDAVTVHQVLHYALDPALVVAEAARVLKPGGVLVVVDYAPHDQEVLRDQHAHRRLGFSDGEVAGWFAGAGLIPASPHPIAGNPLTVILWQAAKPVATQPRAVSKPLGATL